MNGYNGYNGYNYGGNSSSPKSKFTAYAIISLILSVFSLICGIMGMLMACCSPCVGWSILTVGLILGIVAIALVKIGNVEPKICKIMAIVGTVVCAIIFLVSLLLFFLGISLGESFLSNGY